MQMAQEIKAALERAFEQLGVSIPEGALLEHPSDLKNGDYASGVALRAKVSPYEFARKIVEKLGSIEGVAKVEIAKAGFINFHLAPSALAETVEEARKDAWGRNDANKGKKVMVEYTDPNPFKEFHIGHLMSNAIGESVARLIEFTGAEVKRANYQGDIGLHVAKAVFVKKKNPEIPWGVAYKMGNDLYDAYKNEIDEINRKLYEGNDSVINALQIEGRKDSLAGFEVIYEKLGMEPRTNVEEFRYFDFYFFEKESWYIGKVIVEQNTPQVFQESDGAIVFHGENFDPSLHTRVFITSQGLPTYEAKELGLLKSKIEKDWKFDESITITANEQKEYFKVVLAAAKQIAELSKAAEKTRHITHGMMRFAEGKMSSRTGNVITALALLQDLYDVAKERAKESRAESHEKLAMQVALAAVKYQILRQASNKDIIFDRERALSLEGDSGPYLQYAHARAHGVMEKAHEQNVTAAIDKNAEPTDLSRLLHRFPEAVEYAARELEPHLLTNYLLEFASAFNRWYANEQILDGSSGSPHKVALTDAVRATLRNGLWLLGIPAPEKM